MLLKMMETDNDHDFSVWPRASDLSFSDRHDVATFREAFKCTNSLNSSHEEVKVTPATQMGMLIAEMIDSVSPSWLSLVPKLRIRLVLSQTPIPTDSSKTQFPFTINKVDFHTLKCILEPF